MKNQEQLIKRDFYSRFFFASNQRADIQIIYFINKKII
jgi:hypothetical protein